MVPGLRGDTKNPESSATSQNDIWFDSLKVIRNRKGASTPLR